MPASHPRESDDQSTKVFVLEAVQQLVAQGLAVCRRCAADEFELELVSGAFRPLETWDADAVMRLFRERLLARLIERHAISEDLARRLLAWRHPGFSAHVGKAIPFEDKKAIEDVACYIVRNPLSLKKLVVRRARVNRARLI